MGLYLSFLINHVFVKYTTIVIHRRWNLAISTFQPWLESGGYVVDNGNINNRNCFNSMW
jgi:hypothetical protein